MNKPNIHWHVGETEKSFWFRNFIEMPRTIGFVWDYGAYDPTLLAERHIEVYKTNDTYPGIEKDIALFLKETIESRDDIENYIILTNKTQNELLELEKTLYDTIDEWCMILIMCQF